MQQYGLYTIVAGFLGGIGAMSLITISYKVLVVILLVSLVIAMVGARTRSVRALLISVLLLAGVCGAVRFDSVAWHTHSEIFFPYVGSEVTLTGIVVREPEHRARTTHVYLMVRTINDLPATGQVLAYVDRTAVVSYGDVLTLSGELDRPESFETDLGRTFNYPDYLSARGVWNVLYYPQLTVHDSGQGNYFVQKLLLLKHGFIQKIELLLPEPQVGLGEGLLLGVPSALGESWEAAFRRTGIIHIVVLSGYNIMLVVVFVMAVVSYVCGIRGRMIFGVAAIIAFAVIVGLSATVVRASIMAGLVLFARGFGQSYQVMRALWLAAGLMVAMNPYLLLFDPGFQLSFLATFGLLLLGTPLATRLTYVPTQFGIREICTATIATQIFVLPFLLYQIGEFSVVAVLVNILVLPMVPVAMLLTFLTGVIAVVLPVMVMPVTYLTYAALSYILYVAAWFSTLPFASFVVPVFPLWAMLVSYGVIGCGAWYITQRDGKAAVVRNSKTLSDWVIETESENSLQEKGGAVHTEVSPVATEKIPIFFR